MQGLPTVSYGDWNYYSFGVPTNNPSVLSANLIYNVPDFAHSIQIGWAGDYSYTAPTNVAAVPELSTWAMMLIAFVVVAIRIRLPVISLNKRGRVAGGLVHIPPLRPT